MKYDELNRKQKQLIASEYPYKANHQLVTPPSICYEGDYVTTYETHMESLDAFYDKGTFNILTSFGLK